MKVRATICCFCEKIRDDRADSKPGETVWLEFNVYMVKYHLKPEAVQLTDAYCPLCLAYYKAFLNARQIAHNQPEMEEQV